MCNLTDSFMEEQYQDPEFIAWLEQKNKNITEQMEHHYNSIEYARDAIAAEMNNQLMGINDQLMEEMKDPEFSSWLENTIDELAVEIFNELYDNTYGNVEIEYKSISEWELLNEL